VARAGAHSGARCGASPGAYSDASSSLTSRSESGPQTALTPLYDGDIPPADSGLTLIRLGVVKLDHQAEENLTWALPNDPAQVKLFKAWKLDRGMKLVLAAGVPLRYRPKVTGDGRIRVPDRERERAEDALRTAANLISISDRSKRSISSPSPPVAFEASSPTGAEFLTKSHEILLPNDPLPLFPVPLLSFNLEAATRDALLDRLDGVSLLAEALASDHRSGRFHEFIRVFERAFKLKPTKLAAPLAAFLDPRLRYTLAEVETWISKRDAVTHADQRSTFATEKDFFTSTHRMEQASYDVLLNKETWRDSATARRSIWTPQIGLTSSTGTQSTVFIGEHTQLAGEASSDWWGSFPIDFESTYTNQPEGFWPHGWWPWSKPS
jgi:hypothetical protein